MSETETIARNLSGELARHRKTQAALAKELGVSEQNISKRLQGEGSFTTETTQESRRNARHEPLPAHDQAPPANRRNQPNQTIGNRRSPKHESKGESNEQ